MPRKGDIASFRWWVCFDEAIFCCMLMQKYLPALFGIHVYTHLTYHVWLEWECIMKDWSMLYQYLSAKEYFVVNEYFISIRKCRICPMFVLGRQPWQAKENCISICLYIKIDTLHISFGHLLQKQSFSSLWLSEHLHQILTLNFTFYTS